MKQIDFEKRFKISKTMSDYFKEMNHELSDREMASLFFNGHSYFYNAKSLKNLNILLHDTKDAKLKKEIQERLQYEKAKEKIFKDQNDKLYLYIVTTLSSEYMAVFDCYELARKYGDNEFENVDYTINKSLINNMEHDNNFTMDINGNKEIDRIFISKDLCPNKYKFIEEDNARFEMATQNFHIPFKNSDRVLNIYDEENKVGYINCDTDSWDDYMVKINREDNAYDYSDVQLLVQYGKEWYEHEHINPLFLDKV